MADANKDTIYIDIDDEITGIIDKLQAADNKVVALVLPKRATALQSIVNMKLLKRASEQSNKNLVLVTTEASLLPLAGTVGLHVAKTPTSRPEIPAAPASGSADTDTIDSIDMDDTETAIDPQAAGDTPVGDLAAASAMPLPEKPGADSGVETLELDNTEPAAAAAAAKPGKAGKAAKAAKPKKNKKLSVPDFNRFRVLLIGGVILLIVLIILGIIAFNVLPKAAISIKTNASNVNTDVDFSLSTSETDFDESEKVVPAKRVQSQKTLTGTANASGQKNNGERARGSVTMVLCTNSPGATNAIASGTGISSGGKTYVTQESASFQYTGSCNGGFRFRAADVDITAQSGGGSFNVNNASFSVGGRSDITASGSASGGTDDIQTVVTQADIDSAKSKLNTSADASVKDDLKGELEDQGLYAIESTYGSGTPATTVSADAGDQANSVTVTQVATYSMLGANVDDIKALLNVDIKGQINSEQQSILSQGITQGSFNQISASNTGASMNIQTTAVVGPALDTDAITELAAGKKSGDIKTAVSDYEGVTDVEVKLSPFWVNKAPKNTSKITVTIAKPTNDDSN